MARKPKAEEAMKKLVGKEIVLTEDEKFLINILRENDGQVGIKELSHIMDKSAAGIIDLAEEVHKKGILIWKMDEVFYLGGATVECPPEEIVIKENKVRIGVIADTLLGSKYQQLTDLYYAFQIAEHEGVDAMFHLGVSAGRPTPSKDGEFFLPTVEEQIEYIIMNYPKSEKFKTKLVSGVHDMSWKKDNANILVEVCRKRPDLAYRGDIQSDVLLRRGQALNKRWPVLKVVYHGGDNSPYSKSYPVQGLVENLIQAVDDLVDDKKIPDVLAVAGQGVHMDLSGGKIRNLYSVPGMRLISPSILKRKNRAVAPSIGFDIITVTFEEDGTFSVKAKSYPLKGIENDYREKFSENKEWLRGLDPEERKVLRLLEESPKSSGELEQALNKSPETIMSIISKLRSIGFNIAEPNASKNFKLLSKAKTKFNVKPINFDDYFFETVREGDVSDTHIGSNSELIPILNEAYDTFVKRGIKEVNHCGDLTNGPPKHDEHNKGEVREWRATPLINNAISLYPVRDGIKTHMIEGDHDGWLLSKVGLDLVFHVAQMRPDINYLGIQDGERTEKRVISLLKHFNWGTGYARSYKPQQVIEDSILKKVAKEPARYRGKVVVILSGGGHVYCAMLYKGVIFILLPCLQGETGFITGLGKISDVGFLIHSVTYSKDGTLTRFGTEYFDRSAKALAFIRKRKQIRKDIGMRKPKKDKKPAEDVKVAEPAVVESSSDPKPAVNPEPKKQE